jgi:hypothetical protein
MKMDVSQLWDATATLEKTAETANAVGFFTRNRLRQECVLDRVMPPQFITQNDLERNTNDDYPLIRVEKELETVAFSLGFRGSAEGNWFDGQKYEIYFGQIRTQEHNKTQEELMTMRAPVVDYFNRNGVFDIGAKADTTFRAGLDAAAAASSNVITSSSTAFSKADAVAMLKQLEIKRVPAGCWIVTEARWNDILLMSPNDLGYTLVGELAINGAKKIPTFLDIPVVRTIEAVQSGYVNSVWANQSVYLCSTPDFLGKNFILQDVQYHMERKYNLLTWAAWMTRGAGIGNINAVVRSDFPSAGI